MSLLDLASLVLAPTATKEGKVYSAIPDTGDGDMTFSRGSAATRVNSEGLIEKERANVVLHSQDFSNASWQTNASATISHGITDPNGGSTASRLTFAASVNSGIYQQNLTLFASGNIRTASIYLKGTVGGENVMIGDANNRTRVTLTTDWFRYKGFAIDSSTFFIIYTDHISGASADTIDIAFAQYENGLVAQSYIPTTTSAVYEGITDDVPRVDYSGGGCPALKLEPQRSNIIESSEYLGDSSWVQARMTNSANEAVSPEGVQNAALIANTTATGNHTTTNILGSYTNASLAISFYAKKKDNDYLQFGIYNSSTKWAAQKINLATGAILGSGNAGSHNTPSGVSVTDAGSDWWRVEALFTTTLTGATETLYLAPTPTDADPTGSFGLYGGWTGATTENVYIYGVQVESGVTYATSYIPTYSVSSTRVADSCSKTGISELIGQSEGTMFWEVDFGENDLSEYPAVFLYDGTSSNRILIQRRGNNQLLQYQVNAGGSNQVDEFSTSAVGAGKVKIAIAYKTNDFVLYLNGNQEASDTSGNTFSGAISQMSFQNLRHDRTSSLILFPTRLTNDQLEELTK